MCVKFQVLSDAFSYPLASTKLSIFKVERECRSLFPVPLTDVIVKCVLVRYLASRVLTDHTASGEWSIPSNRKPEPGTSGSYLLQIEEHLNLPLLPVCVPLVLPRADAYLSIPEQTLT